MHTREHLEAKIAFPANVASCRGLSSSGRLVPQSNQNWQTLFPVLGHAEGSAVCSSSREMQCSESLQRVLSVDREGEDARGVFPQTQSAGRDRRHMNEDEVEAPHTLPGKSVPESTRHKVP